MKNDSSLPVIIVLVVLALGAGAYFLLRDNSFIWSETLRSNKEHPYDLSVMRSLVEASSKGGVDRTTKPVSKTLKDETKVNYFRVGYNMNMDSLEIDTLFKFIEKGNTAFISVNYLPDQFYDEFDRREIWLNYIGWHQNPEVESVLQQSSKPEGWKYVFKFKGYEEDESHSWRYIHDSTTARLVDEEYETFEAEIGEESDEVDYVVYEKDSLKFDSTLQEIITVEYDDTLWFNPEENFDFSEDESEEDLPDTTGWAVIQPLGHFETGEDRSVKYMNFCVADIGEGRLFIHSNPIMFSNYYIMQQDGFDYCNEVLSHLPNNPGIWDDHYYFEEVDYSQEYNPGRTPLKFVFENPPLKYAWYTLLGATLLFILFRSKRRQNVIPIIPPVENTSIAFAQSLGVLYHQAGSGRYLAFEMMKLFNNFNRRTFGIQRKAKDEKLAEKIAKKARVSPESIEKILTLEKQIVYNPSSEVKEVVKLYDELEAYYKQVRK